ncbi:DoxX family protein [Burkholderia cenocepacia]|uniref:DoxX family protein n=1 Tax=Burkholderia cenocepacia TaxID=95486 RepID=UPI001B9CE7CD|nr:DoxX family protein [Burkholderia cenocepacia]
MKFSSASKTLIERHVPLVLGIFFLVGGSVNLVGPPPILAEYQLWGYPPWFHWVTGTIEISTASLMVLRKTRPYAALLGFCVMFGAATTLTTHHAWIHAVLPVCVMLLLYAYRKSVGKREKRSERQVQ